MLVYRRWMDRLQELEPEYLNRRIAILRSVSIVGAVIAIAISAAVLLMDVSHDVRLYEEMPSLFAMKVNSAIGFAAAGGALLARVHGRVRTSAALAVLPLLIGVLTLLEYLGVHFRIDELLIRDWHAGAGEIAGRSPPNSATVLLLAGAIFLILAGARGEAARKFALLLAPFAILAIAMEVLAGHIGHSDFAIGWWSHQPMSIPGALCALSLAGAILAYGGQFEMAVISRLPIWIPFVGYFGVALIDLYAPREVNAGALYVPLVFTALWFQRGYITIAFAVIATLFIVLGLFASPPGHISFDIAAINRAFAIGSVWLVAALVYGQHIARRRLQESRLHFATAQTIAAIGSFELRFADMLLRGSNAFQKMHGLPVGQAGDWPSFLRKGISPDERGAMEELISAAQGGTRSQDLDYSYLRPDGAVRTVVLHADLLFMSQGVPAGIIGVVHDVTDIRHAQAQQADIELQLRHAQKLESLGMFAGGIAHDLNNTLVPITTLAPLLMETADEADRQILDIILGAARRAKDLVREMLVFSRKEESAHEAIRLDLLVRDALTIIRAGIPASIVIVDELGPVPEMLGSKGQIYQTILNLATNAAHAIGDRAGTITIGASHEPDVEGEAAGIRLFIADDGPGMDVETAQHIFEPYFSTKQTGSSTGLGLAIVNKIVKSHGGSILVRSTVGHGTRFDLLFPARQLLAA